MLIPRTRSLATGSAGRVAVLNGAHTLICGAKEKHFKPNGGSTGSWKMTEKNHHSTPWNAMELTGFKTKNSPAVAVFLLHFYSPTLPPACSLMFFDLAKPSRRSSRRASIEEHFFFSPRITKLSHLVLPHARALAEVPWGTGEVFYVGTPLKTNWNQFLHKLRGFAIQNTKV